MKNFAHFYQPVCKLLRTLSGWLTCGIRIPRPLSQGIKDPTGLLWGGLESSARPSHRTRPRSKLMLLNLVQKPPIADIQGLRCMPAIPPIRVQRVLDQLRLSAILQLANNGTHAALLRGDRQLDLLILDLDPLPTGYLVLQLL